MSGYISKDKKYLAKLNDSDRWRLLNESFKEYQYNFGISCSFLTQTLLFACNENGYYNEQNECDFQKAFFIGNIMIEWYRILKVLEWPGINKEKIKVKEINLLCWQQMKDYYLSIRHPDPTNILEFDISPDFMMQISALECKFSDYLKNKDLKTFKSFLLQRDPNSKKCISKFDLPNNLNENLKTLYYLKILHKKFDYFYPKWINWIKTFFQNIKKQYPDGDDMYKFWNSMWWKYSLNSCIFIVWFQIVKLVEERGIFGYKYYCQVKMINEFKEYFDFKKHFFLQEKYLSNKTNIIKQFNFLEKWFSKIIRPYKQKYDEIKISDKFKWVK